MRRRGWPVLVPSGMSHLVASASPRRYPRALLIARVANALCFIATIAIIAIAIDSPGWAKEQIPPQFGLLMFLLFSSGGFLFGVRIMVLKQGLDFQAVATMSVFLLFSLPFIPR